MRKKGAKGPKGEETGSFGLKGRGRKDCKFEGRGGEGTPDAGGKRGGGAKAGAAVFMETRYATLHPQVVEAAA